MEDKIICRHCGKEIDGNKKYMRLLAKNLHQECLFEYMLKLKIFVIINEDSEKAEERS